MALQEHRVVRAGQLEGQQQADARLRRALLLPDAAVGHDAAGLELPARPVQRQRRREALPAGVHRRLSLLGRQPARHGPGARQRRRGADARPTPWTERFIGRLDARLEPVQRRLPGRPGHQRPAAGRQRVPGLAPLRLRLRPHGQGRRRSSAAAAGSSTTGRRATGVRHDRQRARRAELDAAVGPAAGRSPSAGGDPEPDAVAEPDRRSTSSRRRSRSGTSASSTSCSGTSSSTSPTSAPSRRTCCARCRSTRCRAARRSCRRTRIRRARRARRRARRRCRTTCCGPIQGYGNIRMWDYSGYAQLPRAADRDQPAVRQRVHVLGLLRLEQGARHQQRRLLGGPAERHRRGDPAPRLLVLPATTGRTTSCINFIYQTPQGRQRRRSACWPTTGSSRASTAGRAAGPYGVGYSIPGIGAANLTGNDGNPARASCSRAIRARGWSSDPYQQIEHGVLRPAAAGQRRRRVGALLPARRRRSTTSTCRSRRSSRCRRTSGSRCGSTRSTRSTTRSSRASTPPANFASLTDRDDHEPAASEGANRTGFGTINGVAPPRTLQLVTRVTF